MKLYVVFASKYMQDGYDIVGIALDYETALVIYNFASNIPDYEYCDISSVAFDSCLNNNSIWLLDKLHIAMKEKGVL